MALIFFGRGLFAKELEAAREWLIERGVAAGPLTKASGGKGLFFLGIWKDSPSRSAVEPG